MDDDRRVKNDKHARTRFIEINNLFGRRRSKRIIDSGEGLRRLLLGRKTRQTATSLYGVRPLGIARQIRPIGIGRVDVESAAPCARLAPGRQHVPHVGRIRAVAIGCKKLLVGGDRVAIKRRRIGVLNRHLRDRLRTPRLDALLRNHWRGRVRAALQHHDVLRQPALAPGRLRATRKLGHASAHLRKHLVQRQARFAQRFSQRLRIWTIGRLRERRDGARSGVKRHQRIRGRINQREAGSQSRPVF